MSDQLVTVRGIHFDANQIAESILDYHALVYSHKQLFTLKGVADTILEEMNHTDIIGKPGYIDNTIRMARNGMYQQILSAYFDYFITNYSNSIGSMPMDENFTEDFANKFYFKLIDYGSLTTRIQQTHNLYMNAFTRVFKHAKKNIMSDDSNNDQFSIKAIDVLSKSFLFRNSDTVGDVNIENVKSRTRSLFHIISELVENNLLTDVLLQEIVQEQGLYTTSVEIELNSYSVIRHLLASTEEEFNKIKHRDAGYFNSSCMSLQGLNNGSNFPYRVDYNLKFNDIKREVRDRYNIQNPYKLTVCPAENIMISWNNVENSAARWFFLMFMNGISYAVRNDPVYR